MSELAGRIALVTGASRGIGYHAALTLARQGAHVIAIARTVGGLEELDDEIQAMGASSTLVPLDLNDFDAIDRLGASIFERWGKLDIWVSSAGILGGLSPLEHIEPKTFEKAITLNLTANWRLIRSLSPLLRSGDAARIIFMISEAAKASKPFWGSYSTSQAGLQALVKTWASECEKTDMRINMLNPGPMRTALRAEAMPGEDKQEIAHPSEITPGILALVAEGLSQNGAIYDLTANAFQH